MSFRLSLRQLAENDIASAMDWYDSRQPGLGAEFVAEVQQCVRRVAERSRMFQCLRRQPEVHRALTRRFPYRIFFVIRWDEVIVFRVLHTARSDREWRRHVPRD